MGDNEGCSSLSALEVGIGLSCNDFIIMMADTSIYQENNLTDSTQLDKITSLDNGSLLMCLGASGPLFRRSVSTGMTLHRLRTSNAYPIHQTVRMIGQTMLDIRRHVATLNVNLMLGTADPKTGLTLYKGDSNGFLLKVPHAYIGINGMITVSIVDKYYRPDLSTDEAYSLLKLCVHHMKRRTVLSYPRFTVKLLDKSGEIKDLPDIKWTDFELEI